MRTMRRSKHARFAVNWRAPVLWLRSSATIRGSKYERSEIARASSRRATAVRTPRGPSAAEVGSSDRTARFVCALHFIDAEGRETAILDTIDGEICPDERGEAGFSYDPIFLLPARGVTFAELPAGEKNRISHRARAAAALLATLETPRAEPEPAPSGGN
jgi:hypothetical protein